MTEGTPVDLDKLRSIGVISKRTKPEVSEGREHPESGKPFKSTTDELGNTVTEHSGSGAAPGVSERQDVVIRPQTIHVPVNTQ
jgi:hypothetical protein